MLVESSTSAVPTLPSDDAPPPSVLRNSGFVRLWLAQIVSQTAQNGLMFVLLVIITARTESSVLGSLLVLSFMLPAVVLSAIAGVLVDRWPKRIMLVVTNAIRAVVCLAFIWFDDSIAALMLLAFVFSSVSQFFAPAESAAIPGLVERRQLIQANGLFQLTLTGSQFIGMVLLAPLLMKLGGHGLFFVVAAALNALAAVLCLALPRGIEPPLVAEPTSGGRIVHGVTRDLAATLDLIRRDALSRLALVQLTMSAALAMLFGLLVPRFVLDVLEMTPDDAVFVFAPVGIGAVLGLRALGKFTSRYGNAHTVTIGMFGAAISVAALASVDLVARLIDLTRAGVYIDQVADWTIGPLHISVLILLTMLVAVPIGFTYALINAPAQTMIHERAPADMRGRFFGTQLMLANLASLVLLLAVGVLADVTSVTIVLFMFAPVVLAVAFYGVAINRRYASPS
jgi:MFS family permease